MNSEYDYLFEPIVPPDWLTPMDKVRLAKINLELARADIGIPKDVRDRLLDLRHDELNQALDAMEVAQ